MVEHGVGRGAGAGLNITHSSSKWKLGVAAARGNMKYEKLLFCLGSRKQVWTSSVLVWETGLAGMEAASRVSPLLASSQ